MSNSVPIVQALAPNIALGCRWITGLVPNHSLYGYGGIMGKTQSLYQGLLGEAKAKENRISLI